MAASEYYQVVQQIYVSYFGRPADPVGLANYAAQLDAAGAPKTLKDIDAAYASNTTIKTLVDQMGGSTESNTLYAGSSTAAFVNAIYTNILNRAADYDGLIFWSSAIDRGVITRAKAALSIMSGALNDTSAQGVIDGQVVANKIAVASNFTTNLNTTAEVVSYAGDTAAATARAMLKSVTDTTNTTTFDVDSTISSIGNIVVPGTTYTLTTGADNVVGGSGNDTISGLVDAVTAANSTLTLADQINGGTGTDTLNVTVNTKDATATVLPAVATAIEKISVHAVNGDSLGSGTVSIDASQFAGVTTINSDRSTQKVAITKMAAGAAATMTGNGTVANGELDLAYSTATSAVTVNVDGGTKNVGNAAKIAVTTGSATSATINSTGAANAVDTVVLSTGNTVTSLTINAATNLTTGAISGFGANAAVTVTGAAAKVDIGTLDSNIKTVDASGLTAGGLTTTLNTAVTSFKGGQGNDVVTAAATTATGASIDAGAGTGDTLVVGATNDIATNGAAYKNFEVLKNTGTASLDASKVAGITSVETAGDGAGFTKLTATEAAAVKVSATQSGDLTFALATDTGTSDVLALNVVGSTATSVVNAASLVVAGFETVNLTAGSGSKTLYNAAGTTQLTAGTDYDSFGFKAAANTDLKTVTLGGDYVAKVALTSNQAKVTTLNASANTAGADLVTGGQTGALTVTGTAVADIITVGAMGTGGTQTINAGAGNDKISGAQADIYAATINGGDGTDTLTITNTSGLTVNDQTFKNISGVEKLAFSTADLTFTIGGYANAMATANGGVLDVTAASLTDTAATSIDATGLGGSNSLKLAATLTASAGTGATTAVSIVGSVGGADNITLKTVAATGKVLGDITIDDSANTSAGVTIDASSLASALDTGKNLVIKSGSGADIVKVGDLAATITAGAGNDTITLGASHTSVETLVFGANSGTDTVNNWVVAKDILDGVSTTLLVSNDLGNGWTVSGTGFASKSGATAADFVAVMQAATLANGVAAAKGVAAYDDGHNTWVVFTDGAATTTDSVIELVGVTGIAKLGTAAADTIGIA